jgi:hypothetical protein
MINSKPIFLVKGIEFNVSIELKKLNLVSGFQVKKDQKNLN